MRTFTLSLLLHGKPVEDWKSKGAVWQSIAEVV